MIFCSGKQEHRLKWAFESCKNGAWGSEPDGEADVICIRAADFDGQSGRLNEGERTLRAIDPAVFEKIALRPGDLVMEKSGGGEKQLVGRTALFDDDRPSVTSNFLARCRPASGIDPAYLNYLMLAIYTGRGTYPHIKQSTGIQNLDLGRYLDMRVSIPELLAQQRIARFLDDKTARIDALIEKKQALQERLAEKRQALITRAVTKGLNPDVPMKPSGVDWLGDIPSHWDLLQLRRVTRKVTTGRTPPSALADYFTDGDVNWFTPGDFGDGIELCDSERKISSTAIDDGVASLYPSGTVFLVAIGATLGKVAIAKEPGSANQQVNAMIMKDRNSPQFLAYFLEGFRNEVRMTSNGNTLAILNQDGTKALMVLRPPVEEQEAISEFLIGQDQRDSIVIGEVERSCQLLAEYRAALVTAAVTGQLPELNG